MNFYYAQIEEDGYCVGMSMLAGETDHPDLIRTETYDTSYLGRKYDRETESWTEEYKKNPEPEPVEPEPTNTMLMEALKEQEQSSLNQEEMLLDQQILSLNIELNTTI